MSTKARNIIRTVAAYYGISPDILLSRKRANPIVWPRMIAVYLCRKHLRYSYPKLGMIFERDHTTMMNAVERVEEKIIYPWVFQDIEVIEKHYEPRH